MSSWVAAHRRGACRQDVSSLGWIRMGLGAVSMSRSRATTRHRRELHVDEGPYRRGDTGRAQRPANMAFICPISFC